MSNEITNDDIEVLEFPENIRTRKGTYVGDNRNADVIFREAVDNSIDECMDGYATKIVIESSEGFHWAADNGRGIPIKMHNKFKGQTSTQVATSNMHAGNKFRKTTAKIGLNGLGLKACNALSNHFCMLSKVTESNWNTSIPVVNSRYKAEGKKHQLYYYIYYQRGIKIHEGCITINEVEAVLGLDVNLNLIEGMSTYTIFQPDETMWKSVGAKVPQQNLINAKFILKKFNEATVEVILNGELITEELVPFKYEYFAKMDIANKEANDSVDFYVTYEFDEDLSKRDFGGSVNSLVTNQGLHIVTHEHLMKDALKSQFQIGHNYILNGLKIFVICLAAEVDYDSQTKGRLVEIKGHEWRERFQMREVVIKSLLEHKSEIAIHVERLNAFAASMMDIAAIDKIKGMINLGDTSASSNSNLPDKLMDAFSSDRSKCELLIVEGRSAANNIAKVKDDEFQALLPLRGKPLNAVSKDIKAVIENEEAKGLITTIGCGVDLVNSLANPRYGTVAIVADADPDGQNICALIAGMIGYHQRFLLDAGMVYYIEMPIFRQCTTYLYPSDDLEKELDRTKPYQHFKGLGEMSPADLKYSLIDVNTRRLFRILPTGLERGISILTYSESRKNLMKERGVATDPYNLELVKE